MANSIDLFLKMQRDLERFRDPLGVGKIQEQLRQFSDPFGIAKLQQQMDLFRNDSSISRLFDVQSKLAARLEGFGKLDDLLGRSSMFSFAERYKPEIPYNRAFGLAATIGELTREVSQLKGYGLGSLAATLNESSSTSLMKIIDATASLDRDVMRYAPSVRDKLLGTFERSAAPWLSAHDALWPHESMILRMSDIERQLAVTSWMTKATVEPTAPPHFELGALTPSASGGARIHIDHDVRCAICGEQLYVASTQTKWIGPERMELRTNVVPICRTCTDRDEQEPGYLREEFRKLLEGPAPEVQLRFEVHNGDETDPVPRGHLRLVPNEPEDIGEDDDNGDE